LAHHPEKERNEREFGDVVNHRDALSVQVVVTPLRTRYFFLLVVVTAQVREG
jgi:hypothetical protein